MRLSFEPCPLVRRALPSAPRPDLIRSLRDRTVRDRHGLYLAEGVRALCSAHDASAPIAALVTCPQLVLSECARSLIRCLRQAGLPTRVVPKATLGELSETHDAQGVLLVLRQDWQPLPQTLARDDLWIGLESIRSPGNLGTLMRSGDGAGASGLVALDRAEDGSPSGVDPYDPSTVRASMGSLFRYRMMRTTHRAFRKWEARREMSVFAATGQATTDYRLARYDEKATMVMLGDERDGLTPGQQKSSDVEVRIPMAGTPDSLNVAMAGTLVLYEVYRQRHPPE